MKKVVLMYCRPDDVEGDDDNALLTDCAQERVRYVQKRLARRGRWRSVGRMIVLDEVGFTKGLAAAYFASNLSPESVEVIPFVRFDGLIEEVFQVIERDLADTAIVFLSLEGNALEELVRVSRIYNLLISTTEHLYPLKKEEIAVVLEFGNRGPELRWINTTP